MAIDYQRKITHQGYGKAEIGLQKYYHKVAKNIYGYHFFTFTKEEILKDNYYDLDDKYFKKGTTSKVAPLYAGGISLIMVIGFFITLDEKTGWFPIMIFIISLISTIFFAIYYFTMPKKEYILSRKDGLITFPGFYWQPNITMRFDDAIFAYSTGGDNTIGAFNLQTIRPTKGYTFCLFVIGGADCYEDMSFITWFMDKNRPLPPGDAFDPYRQQDFERRKAAGFPKPLYFSKVPTPEATPEQQAERKRIGGW
ncbi:hypothetical protein HN014_04315 [Aquimarina sp. TRL1]|uniref:hypothetical protein n=1 Tax=Aquimarina sp. (strain TRL1) TaxID=2736252 RepID=UPI00158DA56E|nr:hypothetical protein [Aquimarina sp. TRL1]QKX04163.1 hypothetical protein HN014_04315 [Aquimarina sp. TRL1]